MEWIPYLPPPFSLNIPDFLCRLPFDFSSEEVLQEMREVKPSEQSPVCSLAFGFLFTTVWEFVWSSCGMVLIGAAFLVDSTDCSYSLLDGPVHPVSPRICSGGVNHGVLCLLNRDHHLLLRMALFNVHSQVNKTDFLQDFLGDFFLFK